MVKYCIDANLVVKYCIDDHRRLVYQGYFSSQIIAVSSIKIEFDMCVGYVFEPEWMAKLNPHVFMEISINKDPPERVLIELFADDVPRTAEKFRARCTGEAHPDLCLKGACFNHIIKGFSAAVCDDSGKGTGGQSTDVGEKGSRNHDEGVLSMFIVKDTDVFFVHICNISGDRVVFGKVVGGKSVIRKMEDVGSIDGKPYCSVKITDSGEMSRIRVPEREKAKGRHKKEEETESDGKRTRSPSPIGVSKYIQRGRGFTEKFSFARRYSTPPRRKSDRTRDRKMEDVGSIDGKPSSSVKITDSGEMSRIRAPEREKAKGRHKKEEETESDGKRTRSPSPIGVSKYIQRGRGFTEKFSFARRYSTPPRRKSDRTRDRYPSNSSLRRRPRSPPRRRSPFPLRYNRMIRKTSRSPDGDRFRERSRSQSPRRHSRSRSPRKRQPIIQDRLGTQKSSIKGGPTSPAE
ncbi:peptidyl-prolyl cis-trans isomerase CYP63 [Capsella rubella]|uniref:peptidyl-prolyl cis-trans isomerase CYP63 n=1 Tax=Capsella rubella TaxID=81985 RepID=UPI000CD578A9|nr:peptidyl-prolyl cis-trans isomerase CYP63 [Capsella rubella]